MRQELRVLSGRQLGVFTWRQALASYTPAEVRTRVGRGQWLRVLHGVYRESDTELSPELRVEAARLSMGQMSAVAAYGTAAELHGFSVAADPVTHVLGPRQSRASELIVHSDRVESGELELVRGTLTTNALRTAIDLARSLPRLDALAVLGTVLGRGVSRADLAVEASRHRHKMGAARAAELIALADARPESPMASRTRLGCIDAGLPYSRSSKYRPPPAFDASTSAGGSGASASNTTAPSGTPARRDFPCHNELTPRAGPSTTPPLPTSTSRSTSLNSSGRRSPGGPRSRIVVSVRVSTAIRRRGS
ncbi:type IV toxin-antitoxin system AbiEi family antitoxin domain-containing protein [Nocardia sp. NPDC050435]|uniref:type IV toxin-antitoxin system AbiEi family antitoxin domain-containing protein n=1 Tax=Nocardia sp. NPDC050435 TaxID=3155040 RepID=UPI0033FC65A6